MHYRWWRLHFGDRPSSLQLMIGDRQIAALDGDLRENQTGEKLSAAKRRLLLLPQTHRFHRQFFGFVDHSQSHFSQSKIAEHGSEYGVIHFLSIEERFMLRDG